jgi:hypothetical protein
VFLVFPLFNTAAATANLQKYSILVKVIAQRVQLIAEGSRAQVYIASTLIYISFSIDLLSD